MNYYYLIAFFEFVLWIHNTDGKASFTMIPPAVKYAVQGQTVRLVWKYTVDNRDNEFEVNSPRWDLYAPDGSVLPIASEDSKYGWQWVLHTDTCPKRLLKRVSKESGATLVINNVTTDDSGVYGCSLVLKISSAVTKKVNLIVTAIPYFTTKPPLIKHMKESQELVIPCSANGFPMPNVTWVIIIGNKSVLKSKGIGSASLHILNMTRNQSGNYRCQASNNPIENPIEAIMEITLMLPEVPVTYTPTPSKGLHISTQFSYLPPKNNLVIEGMDLELNCSANGSPPPKVTWFELRQGSKLMKTHGIGEATLVLRKIRRENNGTYECRAVNDYNETEIISFFTIVMVMCYCAANPYNYSTEMKSKFTDNETESPIQLQETDLDSNIINGETFMIALLTVTCVSVFINILLIIYICLKTNRNHYNVANKDSETVRFGPPSVSQKTGSEDSIDSTPVNILGENNEQSMSIKPANAIYERIPDKPESASPNKAPAYDSPTETKNYQRPKSAHSAHDEERQPASRLQHHYQELDNFTSTLNQQEYQSLDRSEVVANPHPKHTSVSTPLNYETLTLSKKRKDAEYQKLHIYANVKDVKTKDDKLSAK